MRWLCGWLESLSLATMTHLNKVWASERVRLRPSHRTRRAIKACKIMWKEPAVNVFAFTRAVNLRQWDKWLSYVLRTTLCDLMSICLENSLQIPGPERLDTVRTLRKHHGKPDARKVIKNICRCVPTGAFEADESAKGKGISSSASSSPQDCFQWTRRWMVNRDPSRFIHTPTPFQPWENEAKIRGKR